jgi:hypothetical protein
MCVAGRSATKRTHQKTFCRFSNLESHKRAMSYVTPRKLMPWGPITSIGNPSRPREINDLVNETKKRKVRREGVPSKARRPLEFDEFKNLIEVSHDPEEKGDDLHRTRISSVLTLQWQLLDASMIIWSNSRLIGQIGTGSSNIEWSNYITVERDAADQIMLVYMTPNSAFFLSSVPILRS